MVIRAMILSSTNMAFYNEVKDFLKRVPDHDEPQKCASKLQISIPFLHSWADSGQGHQQSLLSYEQYDSAIDDKLSVITLTKTIINTI